MALAPVEIRHVDLDRAMLGYRRSAVDSLLDDIAKSFEDVWRERADLADKVEQLEADLQRHRELEALLRTTLVSAERSAQELLEHARRQADLIVGEAHAEARSITHAAAAERERLLADSSRVRALLEAALGSLERAETSGQSTRAVAGVEAA